MKNPMDFIKDLDDRELAIPDPSFLRKEYHSNPTKTIENRAGKHDRAYDAFCKWAALPKELRVPKSEILFEGKWKLPKGYCTHFKARRDFRNKRATYFWDWMMDMLPDVVYSQYKKVLDDGNTNAAKFFADLIAKRLDAEKPEQVIQPLAIIGVPQDKINKLFTPKGYEDTKGIIPIDEEK